MKIVFPLSLCRECGGTGTLHTSHSFDCYECDGVGYLWHGKKIPDRKAPDIEKKQLVMPCCEDNRAALWKKAINVMKDFHTYQEQLNRADDIRKDLEKKYGVEE